ncbi:MAG: diaminopimelate decarboxylase [Planctomycetota bacterium]
MELKQRFSIERSKIAGIPVSEIAAKFQSPCYVYDAALIRERISQLRQFDVIRYAQKANSNLSILRLMREEGVVVDAVSVGEVVRAKNAGYELEASKHEVVYTADIFDRESLSTVVDEQMHVNAGSTDMIRQFGARASGREITLRINPGFGHGHSQKTNTGGASSKHGIWHAEIDEAIAMASDYDLKITGLHMHIGSGADFEHLSSVCEAMEKAALTVGATISTISAGGGLPTPYREGDQGLDIDRYFQLWDETRKRLEQEFGNEIRLEIEPGRFLVAECGYLVTEIRAIKKMGDNLFYLVDAGFNNLARPILYGAYHPMSIAFAGKGSAETADVIIGGPLCESGDIFTQEEGGFVSKRNLPVAGVGDFLVIECAGAYGYVMASNYNSKPLVAEALIENGQAHCIRKRQTYEQMLASEII